MTTHIETVADAPSGPVPEAALVRSPAIFLPLYAPYGVAAGYVSVTLAFLLGRAGLSTLAVTAVIAASVWPQTWKVLWAPLVDTVGDPRWWYGAGAVLTAATLLLLSTLPATAHELPVLTALVTLSSVASTLVSMASELFLTHGSTAATRGRASGWAQAGNVGGAGVGGGLGLLLSQHVAQAWFSGAVLASICVACWAAVLGVPRLPRSHAAAGYAKRLRDVAHDVWTMARTRAGYLALLMMLLPIASGGVPWAAIAGEWRAGADTVALVNGMVGGVVTALGALAGGYLCDRLDAKRAYALFGLLAGVTAAAMAVAPRTPFVFVGFTLAYGGFVGCGYAAYSAVVLEAIGRRSAATNFNLLAALSNVPIAVMPLVDGWTHDRFGTVAMLVGELAIPIITLGAFALVATATGPRSGNGVARALRT